MSSNVNVGSNVKTLRTERLDRWRQDPSQPINHVLLQPCSQHCVGSAATTRLSDATKKLTAFDRAFGSETESDKNAVPNSR
ncbi:hypothetical protein Hte_006411 [Hypoxylon texense]